MGAGKELIEAVLLKRAKQGDGLAMDFASRMERAKAQGFDTDTYHYSVKSDDIKSIREGDINKSLFDSLGLHSGTKDSAAKRAMTTRLVDPNTGKLTDPRGPTYPLKIKSGRELLDDSGNPYTESELAARFEKMFKDEGFGQSWDNEAKEKARAHLWEKYDSIPYINEVEDAGSISYISPPSNIRSVNATFDPSKKDSANLLAGSIPAAVGLGALMGGEEAEAGVFGEALGQAKRIPDLMQPLGKSKMVGNEKLILDSPDLKIFEADPDYVPKGAGKSYRYVKYQDGEPVSVLQFSRDGKKGNKATIQNVETMGDSRRQGHAKDLLERARQDFDIKHSTDLTDKGRAWSKAVPSVVGATALGGAVMAPEEAQAYNPSTDTSTISTGSNRPEIPPELRQQDSAKALRDLHNLEKGVEATYMAYGAEQPQQDSNLYPNDYGSISADEYPYLQIAGDFIEKWTQTPLGGSPVEGLAEYLRGFGNDDDTQAKATRAFWAAMDAI